jgi:hypothetical protein
MLPSKIRLFGKIVPIYKDETLEGQFGEWEPFNHKIRIKPDLPLDVEADTLIHEIIHGIDDSLLLQLRERQVHNLGMAIIAVLKDNKELMSYLNEVVKDG